MAPFLTFCDWGRAFHLHFLPSGSNIWCTTTRVTAVSLHYSAVRSEIFLPCAPPLYDQCPWLLSCVRRISTGTQCTYCYCHAGGIPFDWLQSTGLGKEGLLLKLKWLYLSKPSKSMLYSFSDLRWSNPTLTVTLPLQGWRQSGNLS